MSAEQDLETLLVFPYDGGQHRTGTREGPTVLLEKLQTKPKNIEMIEVNHGTGYEGKDQETPIVREGPVGSAPFMWNAESLKTNTRLIAETVSNRKTPDCFCLFGDHSMEGGFFSWQ